MPISQQTSLIIHMGRFKLVLLYYFELSFYLASMFMLVWWEARRRDFFVMMLHHVVTATLIGLSLRLKCVM